MKTLKYIALSLLAAACTTACQDDPELLTTDIGPEMTAVSSDASGVFGGKVGFEATMTDRYALSTLKAQVFFDDEMVAEEVIRTKENGTYSGTVTLPFYKNIPDGEATLRLVGQNVRFGVTTLERPLNVTRPKPDHLTFVLGGQEYRMEPTGVDYEYAVTADFPQKPQGYITTPDLDGQGSVVTFGYSAEQGGIVSDSTEPIPFANSNAGEFAVTFNLKTFEGSPFIKLLFDNTEMTMVDNDNYSIVTTLTQNQTYTLTGVSDFAGWDIDRDFFERADESNPEALTFLPMSGMYKVTANFKHSYLRIEAMKSATEYASLNADGSGNAIWTVGAGIGKPVIKNGDGWDMASTGLCLARVADKKFQITLVAGISINASSFNFKFFWPKDWDKGEFLGKEDASFANPYGVLTTASDLIEISDGGNLGLAEGKTLELGGIYRFTIDVSGGTMAAVLTVEHDGNQPLPAADLQINGTKMAQLDADNYQLDLDLTQGQTLTFGGADMFTPAWIDDNYFNVSETSATFIPVAGRYRILVNLTDRFIRCYRITADGGYATTAEDGSGGIWLMGWGVGAPSMDYQFGFDPFTNIYCMPEVEPMKYRLTGKAGPEKGSSIGDYFRTDYISMKYFFQHGWGGEMMNPTIQGGLLKAGGNLELNNDLELGAVYELTIDLSAGRDHGVVSFIKK
ncbi:DUF5125 domain-containing protein [Alistipes timonensis]|uniref:DUF5125 domain-containing protein n=1 Tax=Alistipes timonensis TaxID=1465754 RepID=UPI001C3C94B8|nr:DUF5125 domain-containing protein [Alistipes timonensis]MCR2030926.1 DUF5125 domain-containing protein [Alistipes timonensis]